LCVLLFCLFELFLWCFLPPLVIPPHPPRKEGDFPVSFFSYCFFLASPLRNSTPPFPPPLVVFTLTSVLLTSFVPTFLYPQALTIFVHCPQIRLVFSSLALFFSFFWPIHFFLKLKPFVPSCRLGFLALLFPLKHVFSFFLFFLFISWLIICGFPFLGVCHTVSLSSLVWVFYTGSFFCFFRWPRRVFSGSAFFFLAGLVLTFFSVFCSFV